MKRDDHTAADPEQASGGMIPFSGALAEETPEKGIPVDSTEEVR